jgi:hypothetical protein
MISSAMAAEPPTLIFDNGFSWKQVFDAGFRRLISGLMSRWLSFFPLIRGQQDLAGGITIQPSAGVFIIAQLGIPKRCR